MPPVCACVFGCVGVRACWCVTAQMYTAAAVLRLVDAGEFDLDSKALPLMDTFFRRLNGTSLESFLGPLIKRVTVRQLLQMRSGIADFDNGPRCVALTCATSRRPLCTRVCVRALTHRRHTPPLARLSAAAGSFS